MIPASRFIVESRWRDDWLEARTRGVTATAVAECATPSGFADHVASWSEPAFEGNGYTAFGSWAERYMMEHAHHEYGILPNDWMLRSADDSRWLATPDGLSPDHRLIAEAKTTGKDWASPPIRYLRQVQWQLLVTGAERCLLLWQLRATADDGSFYTGWLEPKTLWIEPDLAMQKDLIGVAERLWEAKQSRKENSHANNF